MNINALDANTLLIQALRAAAQPVNGAQTGQAAREAQTQRPVQAPVPAQELRKELDAALERLASKDTRLSFQVDDDSGRTVITVRDATTSEVLKQIPSEEMLNVARRLEAHLSESGDGSGVLHADEA